MNQRKTSQADSIVLFLLHCAVLTFFLSRQAYCARKPISAIKHFFLTADGGYLFGPTTYDNPPNSGDIVRPKFSQTTLLGASLGTVVLQHIYMGGSLDYFLSYRGVSSASGQEFDTLKYVSVGPEIGYFGWDSKRLYWLLLISALVPIEDKVETSTGTTYSNGNPPITGRIKVALGIYLNSFMTMNVSVGYRYADLGELTSSASPGASFLQSSSFTLSGIQIGFGCGFYL